MICTPDIPTTTHDWPTMPAEPDLTRRWRELSAVVDLCHDPDERAILLAELRDVEREAAGIIEGGSDE